MNFAALMTLVALSADEPKWQMVVDQPAMKIYSRERSDSPVREMKAIGTIDATPQEIWKVLNDLENYKTNMPYTAESKIVKREGEKTTYFYSRLNTPMVDGRDYVIKLVDESKWDDGKGFLKVSWTIAAGQDDMVAPKKDIVRIKTNDGYWLLEPKEDGKKTLTTYYIYTSPGGSIPTFIANSANGIAVPKVFESIKKTVESQRKK